MFHSFFTVKCDGIVTYERKVFTRGHIYVIFKTSFFFIVELLIPLAFYPLIPSGKLKGFLLFFRKYHVIIFEK